MPSKPTDSNARLAPAVVAADTEQRERRRRRRDLVLSLPYLLAALVVHAGLLGWYWWVARAEAVVLEPPRVIRASTLDVEAEPPVSPEPPPPPELDPPETVPDDLVVERPSDPTPSGADILGLAGQGAGTGTGAWGGLPVRRTGDPEARPGDAGDGFRSFVSDLRQRGLDVVFVVDATASMQEFIDRARDTVDEIIGSLSTVVPDLRLGIVAYRDRSDAWLSRHVDLTRDRYRIHTFLLELEAEGGGDFEEAVGEGLRVAVQDLAWRDGARRVMILVGDAPPHPEDEAPTLALVRAFSRGRHSLVNVLFTGVDPTREPTQKQARARAVLTRIARTGDGVIGEMLSGQQDLTRPILEATFGPEWYQDVRGLLGREGEDRRSRIVDQKVSDRDVRWLIDKLGRTPVHPAVVDGCIQLFDVRMARAGLRLLLDETRPSSVRSAALYILKRKLGEMLRVQAGSRAGLVAADIDVTSPLGGQEPALRALEEALEEVLGAAWNPPPVPPPNPAGSRP